MTLEKGCPWGNWTSQFFANVYLHELDQFVKHQLKAKHYIRYVDDFVILHGSHKQLKNWEQEIDQFLKNQLQLELHPQKCKIIPLNRGVGFLGFRAFYHYKLVTKRNIRKLHQKITTLLDDYEEGIAEALNVLETLRGWNAYAMHGNTYHLCKRLENTIISELEARTKTRIKTTNK